MQAKFLGICCLSVKGVINRNRSYDEVWFICDLVWLELAAAVIAGW